MTTTSSSPPPADTRTINKLTTLLQSCLEHVQAPSSEFSPVYLWTMAALQEHAIEQLTLLQTQISHLQSKRQECLELLQKDEQERQRRRQADLEQLIPSESATTALAMASTAATSTVHPNTTNASTATNATNATNHQPHNTMSSATANHVQVQLTESHLTPLELQKKALMEKRRQEVLEQRKKAAAEQKRKKEEERRKFLEYEQRKQDLKFKAAQEAALLKEKAQQQEEIQRKAAEAAAAAFPQPSPKTPSRAPSASPESVRTTPLSMNNEPRQFSVGLGRDMHVPNLPTQPISTATNNSSGPVPAPTPSPANSSSQHQPPSPPPPPELSMPSHTPTGTDAKYRNMMSQPSEPPAPALSETPQHIITALKHNVLLQWALLPPGYQVLKPIPQLLCQIHTVYPPALGLPSHDYFQGWTPIVWSELATNSAWDPVKLKKAVRKVRFFLHPDKLPRDLNDAQQFLCKLLWDVVNDAYEDHQSLLSQQEK